LHKVPSVVDNLPMSGIRTSAAAVMLGVSPSTLRSWERRYGFPHPQRSTGGHRLYALAEIAALKQTLAETHNVSSAINLANQRGEGPASPARLVTAFAAFDELAADRLLEESLTLRSLERTIEEVLLEALQSLAEMNPGGAEYEFAWRRATGWMSAMQRLTPPAAHEEAVLLLDGSIPCDLDALHIQALELMLRRSGLRSLTLTPAIDVDRLGRAVRALHPSAVVLAGPRLSLDHIGRLVYAIRRTVPDLTIFDFRGAVPDTGASTVRRLGDRPLPAREGLCDWIEGRDAATRRGVGLSPAPVTAVAAGA
jgi:DNA-binding transcriptional MerR regulator